MCKMLITILTAAVGVIPIIAAVAVIVETIAVHQQKQKDGKKK